MYGFVGVLQLLRGFTLIYYIWEETRNFNTHYVHV